MKIVLISDTHGYYEGLAGSIKEQQADYILHMGDGVEEAHRLKRELELPVLVVAGNNDYGTKEKEELFLILEHIPIFMMHGHRYGVHYGREQLAEAALQKGAKLALYGHTHIFRDEEIDGVRLINPGSPTLPRGGGSPSYAVLDLTSGELKRVIVAAPKGLRWLF